ncbi:hypothetical protein RCH06_003647 [Polaromonas sp. CG_9.5]|nr:hypothetical protein [Polaromonas sp. CG_9.5]
MGRSMVYLFQIPLAIGRLSNAMQQKVISHKTLLNLTNKLLI